MTGKDIKQALHSLPDLLIQSKLTKFEKTGVNAMRVDFPFTMMEGGKLPIYFLKRSKKRKLSLISPLYGINAQANLATIQALLKGYGLILTEDKQIAEESNRPLGHRLASMVQGLIAIDAMARGMKVVKDVRTNERALPESPDPLRKDGSQAPGTLPDGWRTP